MNEVGNGMIVVGDQGEWRRDCMLPIGVHFGNGRLLRVKPIAMEDIGHRLHLVSARWSQHLYRSKRAYLPKEQAEEQVFGNTPWHRQPSAQF